MVCLGNICRSPVADGLLRKKVEEAGLQITVDSCGTGGWHSGESPDDRSQENAMKNGLDISMLRARQIQQDDLDKFDHILVMDRSNRENVLNICTNETQRNKVKMILSYSHPGQDMEVPDPYFGTHDGFQNVFDLLNEACDRFLEEILAS